MILDFSFSLFISISEEHCRENYPSHTCGGRGWGREVHRQQYLYSFSLMRTRRLTLTRTQTLLHLSLPHHFIKFVKFVHTQTHFFPLHSFFFSLSTFHETVFKFALDWRRVYGSDHFAAKAAGQVGRRVKKGCV